MRTIGHLLSFVDEQDGAVSGGLNVSQPSLAKGLEAAPAVVGDERDAEELAELRILTSTDFDSRSILTVVLAGDGRLTQHFNREDLLPIASRIRVRLTLDYLPPKELLAWLEHTLKQAGHPRLLTAEIKTTLTEHAASNLRVLATMGNELLALAAHRELTEIDQKLYLEIFAAQPRPRTRPQLSAAATPRT